MNVTLAKISSCRPLPLCMLVLLGWGACGPVGSRQASIAMPDDDVVVVPDAATQHPPTPDASVKPDILVAAPDLAATADLGTPPDASMSVSIDTAPMATALDALPPREAAAPSNEPDAPVDDTLNLAVNGTSKTFRTKILPWLIQHCGSCHGDVFRDRPGPDPTKTNDDELYALRWLRGKTKCQKATTKERVLPATFTDDRVTAAKSYLWKKLNNAADICGSPMPMPAGKAAWSKIPGDQNGGELFIISDWIAHGGG